MLTCPSELPNAREIIRTPIDRLVFFAGKRKPIKSYMFARCVHRHARCRRRYRPARLHDCACGHVFGRQRCLRCSPNSHYQQNQERFTPAGSSLFPTRMQHRSARRPRLCVSLSNVSSPLSPHFTSSGRHAPYAFQNVVLIMQVLYNMSPASLRLSPGFESCLFV